MPLKRQVHTWCQELWIQTNGNGKRVNGLCGLCCFFSGIFIFMKVCESGPRSPVAPLQSFYKPHFMCRLIQANDFLIYEKHNSLKAWWTLKWSGNSECEWMQMWSTWIFYVLVYGSFSAPPSHAVFNIVILLCKLLCEIGKIAQWNRMLMNKIRKTIYNLVAKCLWAYWPSLQRSISYIRWRPAHEQLTRGSSRPNKCAARVHEGYSFFFHLGKHFQYRLKTDVLHRESLLLHRSFFLSLFPAL